MSGKTEWEDILIEKGIIAPPPEEINEDDLQEMDLEAYQNRVSWRTPVAPTHANRMSLLTRLLRS